MKLWHDFHFAVRSLQANIGLTSIAILSLALGIGATTSTWGVLDSVLISSLPYSQANRLVTPSIISPGEIYTTRFPVRVFLQFQKQNHTFEDMVGLAYLSVRYKHLGTAEEMLGGWVTPNAFKFLGIKPMLGREIGESDANPDSPPVAVLSYESWTRTFNADPNIVGRSIILNGTARTLIAVMPPRFRFGGCKVWLPVRLAENTFITGFGIQANELWTVGRIKKGIAVQQATADLQVISKQFEKDYPAWFRTQYKISVSSLVDDSVGPFKSTIWLTFAAASVLLLIACGNVSNLILARATAREREIAIRSSLGATFWDLARLLFCESALLAAAGTVIGILFAVGAVKGISLILPKDTIPTESVIGIRTATLLVTLSITALATILCGLVPAFQVLRRDINAALPVSGRSVGSSRRQGKLRGSLVVAEIGLSITLLVGSGLLMRTLLALEKVDIGFDPSAVAYADLSIPEGRYDTADQKRLLLRRILDRVELIPGVVAAAEASSVPPYSFGWTEISFVGNSGNAHGGATFDMCSEGYFASLNRRLLVGRLLSREDVDGSRHVMVVNETFVREYLPARDPFGGKVKLTTFEDYTADWPKNAYFEIVGIIADAKNQGLQEAPKPEMYFPHTLTGTGPRHILVRTDRRAASILPDLLREIRAVDPDLVVSESGSIERSLDAYWAVPRFVFEVLLAFAGIGLVLALIGTFGVTAYTVSLRTKEIGIRVAVGAQQACIVRMVLVNGLTLTLVGAAVGLLLSFACARILANQIWGVSAADPLTFAVAAGLVILASLGACIWPAVRASRIDPLLSLRCE